MFVNVWWKLINICQYWSIYGIFTLISIWILIFISLFIWIILLGGGEQKHTLFQKGMSKNKTPAASLKRRKCGLGLPIHIKYQLILLNIWFYMILVSHRSLYINYQCLGSVWYIWDLFCTLWLCRVLLSLVGYVGAVQCELCRACCAVLCSAVQCCAVG